MKIRPIFAIILPFILLAGCSIHPLPDDVEGSGTIQIVERIRCEAVVSIQDETIALLKRKGDSLAELLDANRDEFYKFKPERLHNQREKDFYNRYIKTGIAYAFTFDISEDNMASTEVDLLKAVTNGAVSLNLTASNDRMRENSRSFVVSEDFEHLLNDRLLCDPTHGGPKRQDPNFVFPVTGSIGLSEVVKTFIDINEEGLLVQGKDDKAPVLTDTLMFTTEFVGSINPQITLTPVGHNFGLKSASLTGKATRRDVNKVIVSLSLVPKTAPVPGRIAAAAPFGGAGGAAIFAKRRLSPAEARAVDAISQQRIDTFYDKFGQFLTR